ncbi:glycosyltransferase family 2 protein [Arthrobacter sp. SDTb3-6]|uniref:glycosyltransferase family A protein n=1 Tax=Arthrobacter sp. SDTb3-6 TaxID=2713571 RepID=UPI00159E438D|nr:glycosyltransferase family 2 protein [Arthrobacter sp. SDTb3-6]
MDNNSQDSVLVDVVVAVHTPDRPIERTVASLMASGLPTDAGAAGRLRVTVVCHNTDVEPIRARVAPGHRNLVRFVAYADGIKSPAGPFNHGLSLATGTWVSIMGSDDSLEPDALARWVEAAGRDGADVLIAPMAHAGGAAIHTPVVRRTRTAALDPVADRLTYRTAPLGIMRLQLVRSLGLDFPTRYVTGEDQSFSAKLWFSGASVSYGRGLPRYLVHDDAAVRVTATPRPVAEDLAFATDLVESDWFAGLAPAQRASIVTKLIRVHLFGHVLLRAEAGTWGAADAAEMAAAARTLLFAAPTAARPLSVADRALLDAVTRREADSVEMKSLATLRRTFTNPRTWLPRDATQLLHPEAPLRFMSASALVS